MTAARLLTLNLWNTCEPVALRMNRLVRFLRCVQPEIVALQEVSPWDGTLQSTHLARDAGYEYVHYSRCGDRRGREEGLAILTAWPSVLRLCVPLPAGDHMPRAVQELRLHKGTAENGLVVLNTHWSYPIDAGGKRLLQATAVADVIAGARSETLVLCGDLNDVPESASIHRLVEDPRCQLRDAWTAAGNPSDTATFSASNAWTEPALLPGRRIDYVLAGSAVRVTACTRVFTESDEWKPVSDHYGVLATLEWDDD